MQSRKFIVRIFRAQIFRQIRTYLLLGGLLISGGLPRYASAQETRAREQQSAPTKEASAADSDAPSKDMTVISVADSAEEKLPEVNKVGGANKWAEEKKADSLANLRKQLAAMGANRFSPPALRGDLKDISRYSIPSAPQSGSGKKIKKGPLAAGLIGLGLIGTGAWLFASYEQPRTLTGLLDEKSTNRRSMGAALIGLGGTVATIGFLSMK